MPAPPLLWDIFCRVVDNHGDLGVCWRLARELAARGHTVRLWVDDASALDWMAPGARQGVLPGVRVLPWSAASDAALLATLAHAEVWIEAFGCELPAAFIAHRAAAHASDTGTAVPPVWINLEYLSAEAWVERMHGLPSPLLHGPAAGWTKWFFYPGFRPRTGGLLREHDLAARQAAFDRAGWRARHGVDGSGTTLISLFCYEPPALGMMLHRLAAGDQPSQLLVTAGRATQAVRHALHDTALPPLPPAGAGWDEGRSLPFEAAHATGALRLTPLPYLPQTGYDELLWACDLNFVRGEDSLVRALWAGQPLVWQLYPQHDDAHHAKLQAFLDWLDAPGSLRRWHRIWNGVESAAALPAPELAAWRDCVQVARDRLLAQPELAAELIRFVAEKR